MKDYSEYILSSRDKIILFSLTILGVITISQLFYDTLILIVLTPIVFKLMIRPYRKLQLKRQNRKILIMFKDLLHSLGTSFSTGRHLEEALIEAKDYLIEIYGEGCILIDEINYITNEISNSGLNEIDLLEDFGKRTNLEDIKNFTGVYRACIESGGNLVESIIKSAGVISKKITIESDIDVIVAQKKAEGYIITIMPIGIILFLRAFSPGYLDIMYSSFVGRVLMTFALAGIGLAFYLIERITRIEI